MLNSFHTKVKDQASTSNALYTMNVWFTNTRHERFDFPRLHNSLRKIKGHVQEDFREVLERFVDQVDLYITTMVTLVEYLSSPYIGKLKEFFDISGSTVGYLMV